MSFRVGKHGNTETGLLEELCDRFDAKPPAMLCALSHGQVSIDGYVVRPRHLAQWTPDQLRGRYARLHGRVRQLYGAKEVHG
jgi:hypothetical protein